MDITTLSLAKKYANKVAAGFSNVEVQGNNLIFTLNDGTKATMTVPTPEKGSDGISIVDVSIDIDGSLLCHMSDGSTINAGKITEYDLHSQELDNKIIATRNELERVKNDILETGTDTDTNIHLEDSAMAEYQELEIDGVCEQETTQGKQLFNYEDTTMVTDGITVDEDGWITATFDNTNGTDYKYLNFYTNNLNLKNSTTYAIVSEIKSVSGTGFLIPVSKTQTGGQFNSEVSYDFATLTNNMIKIGTPTTIDDLSTTNYGLRTLLQFAKGQSGSITFRLSVLEDTSVTADTFVYEKFTGGQPSPSPEFPQPISTIENSLKITSCNKNLAYDGWAEDFVNRINNDYLAKIENKDGRRCLKWEKQVGYKDYDNKYIFKTNWKENTQYTFSFDLYAENANNYGNICIEYTDGILQEINGTSNTWVHKTTTSTNGKTIKYLRGYWRNGYSYIDLDTFMVSEGTTATPYEQHLETQITANLPEGEFIGKISDTYKDTLKVEYNETDGQYHLILNKMVGKVVLNGSEKYTNSGLSSYNHIHMMKTIINNIKSAANDDEFVPVMSNYFSNGFSYRILGYSIAGTNGITIAQNNTLTICHPNYTKENTEGFKTWLSTHNTEAYYPLETPYTLDLGIVEMPITYNEITNLFTDSGLLQTINAKYYRNFISTVRNLQVNEKALKQELVDINARLSALETAQTSVASESEVVE